MIEKSIIIISTISVDDCSYEELYNIFVLTDKYNEVKKHKDVIKRKIDELVWLHFYLIGIE